VLSQLNITDLCVCLSGDFWPGEAEVLLSKLSEEQRQAGKKGGGRSVKGSKGKRYASAFASADEQLLSKLGDTVSHMREDFIVVHFREPCSFCREYISDEMRCVRPCV
jgi:E1A/CREB-binding protein